VLVAGQPTYIDLKAVASLNATQSLWGKAEYAYATFESGDTAFGALSGYIKQSRNTLRIAFTPPSAGNHTFTIDLMARDGFYPVYHRRYTKVKVLPAAKTEASKNVISSSTAVRRCEGLPDRGQWARCTAAGLSHPHECLRMGHTFRPLTPSRRATMRIGDRKTCGSTLRQCQLSRTRRGVSSSSSSSNGDCVGARLNLR